MKLTQKQDELQKRLESAGYHGRWWERPGVPARFYFDAGRRDAKVYLAFDEPGDCWGCALKISLKDCGQPPAWYASQRQRLAQSFAEAFAIALAVGGGETAANAFRAECDRDDAIVGDLVGEAE